MLKYSQNICLSITGITTNYYLGDRRLKIVYLTNYFYIHMSGSQHFQVKFLEVF
jgi:hypothetical protein